MKTTKIIATAVLALAAASATSAFAAQGEIKTPPTSATRAAKYQHGAYNNYAQAQGKTRAEVRAQLREPDAMEFNNRNTQR